MSDEISEAAIIKAAREKVAVQLCDKNTHANDSRCAWLHNASGEGVFVQVLKFEAAAAQAAIDAENEVTDEMVEAGFNAAFANTLRAEHESAHDYTRRQVREVIKASLQARAKPVESCLEADDDKPAPA